MTGRSRVLTVVLAGAVGLGCGARKALPGDAATEPPSPDAMAAPLPGDGAAPAPDAAAEDQPPGAAKLRSCAAGQPLRVALATVQDDNVLYVMSDGSSRVVYRFPTMHEDFADVSVVEAGGDVFATWTLWGPTDTEQCPWKDGHPVCPESDRLVRLDLDGHVLWEKAISGHESSVWIGRAARDELAAVLPPPSPAPTPTWKVADDGDAVVRTNLVTGETERIVFAFPAGMSPLGTYSLDHEGSFARVLRNDYLASAYLSPDGTSWKPLGKRLGEVEHATVQDVGGTYLVTVRGTNSVFSPTQEWSAVPDGGTPAELRGNSLQLLRPSAGLSVLANAVVGLTSDGLCAAYVEAPKDRFVLHDLAHDVRTPIAGARGPGGAAAFTMIE